jgi:NAD/NADP transhydrogenase alpha subunit
MIESMKEGSVTVDLAAEAGKHHLLIKVEILKQQLKEQLLNMQVLLVLVIQIYHHV